MPEPGTSYSCILNATIILGCSQYTFGTSAITFGQEFVANPYRKYSGQPETGPQVEADAGWSRGERLIAKPGALETLGELLILMDVHRLENVGIRADVRS